MKSSLWFAIAFLTCGLNIHAAEFLLVNKGVDEYIAFEVKDKGKLELRNFRARVIADVMHHKKTKRVLSYLNDFQTAMPKALFPPTLCESAITPVYKFTQPTTRLTLVLSADGYRGEEFVTKVMLYAEDFKLGDAIKAEHLIKIELGSLTKSAAVFRFAMTVLVDKRDGQGFKESETCTERYMTLF